MNYYSSAIPTEITKLTNDGSTGAQAQLDKFQTLMNTGDFVCRYVHQTSSLMLESIYKDFNPESGEVGLFDIRYEV